MEKNGNILLGRGYDDDDNGGMESDGTTPLQIKRPVYQIEDLNVASSYESPHSSIRNKLVKLRKSINPAACLRSTIPLLSWLPEYRWRKDFHSDVISGITVAIMHIPQGMAYGLLGGVPPVVGIYMAFFPVLIYFIFGTSRHISIGTFAVVCLMTGKVVNQYSTVEIMQNGTIRSVSRMDDGSIPLHDYTNIQVAITVTFTVACIQLVMYILRMGVVSTLLSETLVNGFICGCAFHVAGSQLKDILGLPISKRRGNFSFFLTLYDAAGALPQANKYACIVSLVCITILVLNNEKLKPWMAKYTRIPFPIELIAVSVGTGVSYILDLNSKYDISVVGRIPTGFPEVTLPAFELIPDIFVDALLITVVSYTVTMSMALIFARKLTYEVDSNQELLAMGLSNTMGSFFSCLPITASLSRSMIQQTVGGVSQIASIVSCFLLMFVLLWIGPVFQSLPRCVLASIIVVALKQMLLQGKLIVKYWKLSKWDAVVWIVTFTTTIVVQISIGLGAGILISLVSIFMQGQKPYTCLLGVLPNTDIYLDIRRYKGATEIPGIKIFHYSGSLNFATRNSFKETLTKRLDFDPVVILRRRAKLMENGIEEMDELHTKFLVVDFSCLTYIDPSGVDFLRQLQAEFAKLEIVLYIVGCSGPVYEVMKRVDRTEQKESHFLIFPTVHDAVLFAQNQSDDEKSSKSN